MGDIRRWASVAVLGAVAGATIVGTASAATVTVEARDNVFAPSTVAASVGDTVTWRNTGASPHTVTSSDDDGARFDRALRPGESFSYTPGSAGAIDYHCRFHGTAAGEGMAGTLSVTATTGAKRATARLAGTSRIQTAVAISKAAFPDGASTVYLSSQDVNPDALVGGALTQGPILLVPSCGTLPPEVAAEIRRLGASEVVALGGAKAVCDQMLQQAADA